MAPFSVGNAGWPCLDTIPNIGNITAVTNIGDTTTSSFSAMHPPCGVGITPVGSTRGQQSSYDSDGAMKFVIVTLLVYALVGVLSLLLVRIIRRAKKRHVYSGQEESVKKYLSVRNGFCSDGHRESLICSKLKVTRELFNAGEMSRTHVQTAAIKSEDPAAATTVLAAVTADYRVTAALSIRELSVRVESSNEPYNDLELLEDRVQCD